MRGDVQNIGIDSFIGDLSSVGSTQQQQHNNHHRKQWQQAGQTEEERKEEKRQGEREKGRKDEGGRGQEGKRKEKEREAEVKKDVTDWTVVTRNRRQNGSKVTPMEVSLTDDRIEDVIRRIPNGEDVYVTMHGRTLRRSEKLNSCGVSDGCTIQVMSRMRGGGKHKDKKSKAEKKQAESRQTLEQKFVEEVRSDKSPVIRECDEDATVTRQESMSNINQETQEKKEDRMIHVLDEDSTKSWVDFWSKGSDNEVGQRMEDWMSVLLGVEEVDVERANIWKCGMRCAVEARRKQRRQQEQEQREQRQADQGQNTGQEQGKQGKHVRFGQEEQQEETRAESTDEPEVTGRLTEMQTGRGSSGLVRGGDEKCQADEISRKGKGKGNGGKGEHEGKRGAGSKGRQQVENLVMDEDQGNTGAMRNEEEEEVRKLVEMMQKKEDAHEGQRGRMAPNMGAVGSHTQAMSIPETRETREMRWADCEDDERKDEEEREQETEKETKQKTGQEKLTSENPPGLEQKEDKEKEEKEKRAQEARENEEKRAQEAREEERRAQEAREEEKKAQEAQEEQNRAQEEREEEKKAQEAQEKDVKSQEEQAREERKAQAEREEIESQEGHEGKEEMTTQGEYVEDKRETNSMQEEHDVSNRHLTWWRNAWWIRVDSGPHMRTARGRRRIWRAARRAAEQARDNDGVGETQSFAEEAEGETRGRKKWEQGTTGRKESNTLHVVIHLPTTATTTTAAAAAATSEAVRLH